MKVLVTGGMGYIGSHICVELLEAGYDVVIADNLSNSKMEVLHRIEKITGRCARFYQTDVTDEEGLNRLFSREMPEVVIHLAGRKAVGESVAKPLVYYQNNVAGAVILCKVMETYHVKNIIFSSSATVYGTPETVPITEDCPVGKAASPYGRTKRMTEEILLDVSKADSAWNVIILRYFNPIGAHESGLLGEDPQGIPNNLLPYLSQVAIGKREYLNIFGNDYPTPDGTGIRDYIHVTDLAKGHLCALQQLIPGTGVHIYNLGTGIGYSVMEVLHAYEQACGRRIPYRITERRAGDIAAYYCDPSKAAKDLKWRAGKDIGDMCRDSWRWQSMNPCGYDTGSKEV